MADKGQPATPGPACASGGLGPGTPGAAAGTAPTFPRLQGDCATCAGLCCIAFAFEPSESFGCDKPAGVPCPHLTRADGCAIHADRAARGFSGCIGYDCLGAGQRVTQELVPGQHWRQSEAIRQRMLSAFRALREVHRLLDLLQLAGRLPLDPAQQDARNRLIAALLPAGGWTEAALAEVEAGPVPAAVAQFLTGLRGAAAGLRGLTSPAARATSRP